MFVYVHAFLIPINNGWTVTRIVDCSFVAIPKYRTLSFADPTDLVDLLRGARARSSLIISCQCT